MSFTINTGKESSNPKRSLFLVTITSPDGDVANLTTAAYYGAPNIVYSGVTYDARILGNDIEAIAAMGPQGYDTVPGFTLSVADADKVYWTNHCVAHGWRGSVITLTVILWDVPTNTYSTDAIQWTFIGGNPQYNAKDGVLSVDATSSCNFSRLKVPTVPIQYRCPWAFPSRYLDRVAGLSDPTSPYFQDGYSPDVPGGVGNLIAKTTMSAATNTALTLTVASAAGFPAVPFQATADGEEFLVTLVAGTTLTVSRGQNGTTGIAHLASAAFYVPYVLCDYTRSSPTDASVGCMARLGNGGTGHTTYLISPVAPDGDLTHDRAGNYTGRFGGATWIAPTSFRGAEYTTSQTQIGFNSPNTAIIGSYYNWVYGTQWVNCSVLAPAGDPNSTRAEAVVCFAAFGPANIIKLLVNGVEIPYGGANSDELFTWRFASANFGSGNVPVQGGRDGALQGDNIFTNNGDPHGSMCVLEFVVPIQLAGGGGVPSVQALVTGPPILNVYAIASVAAGVVTFTQQNWSCAGNPPFTVLITGNSNPALNGSFGLSNWTSGPPGTVTLTGSSASGTGGAVFFYGAPDLFDTGVYQSNNVAGPAANPVFAYLDLMTWGNVAREQIDPISFAAAAMLMRNTISYQAADGSTQTHAAFKCSFQLAGSSRQTLAQTLTGIRNAANLMVAPNSITGLIQCFVKETLADQQPSIIPGSNDSTARSSPHTDSTLAVPDFGTGYYAYLFDETCIEKDSFRITSPKINAIPNTVAFGFQDEYNGYQNDSLTEIDPASYKYSGNQEINVPISMIGIPNFDQGTRQANVLLAEALFGNERDDAGGTLYFEFSTNQRVIHLSSRLGFICGLVYQSLGIGLIEPQAIRILSVKPDTDGEHWQVKAAWHQDYWYTTEYGQNPTPYQNNPILTNPQAPPYPYAPGFAVYAVDDAMFPSRDSFIVDLDTTPYPAVVTVSGMLPVNDQPTFRPPITPPQCSISSTGGFIKPGTYYIALSVQFLEGPVSRFAVAVVPPGTNTNTVILSNIQWNSGASVNWTPYAGMDPMHMRAFSGIAYVGSVPDTNGNPTTITFSNLGIDGPGLPDISFSGFDIIQTEVRQGGDWGYQIESVAGGVLTFLGGGLVVNDFAHHTLSLIYRQNVTTQPALNAIVTSNTASTVTTPSTGFLPGDTVIMRFLPDTITDSTIGSSTAINSFNGGTGLADFSGMKLMILSGTGAGYPPKTILSNTTTVFTINGTWDVTPDATTVFIVINAKPTTQFSTPAFSNDGSQNIVAIGAVQVLSAVGSYLMLQVATVNAKGDFADLQYQPFRELFVPPQLTPVVTAVFDGGGAVPAAGKKCRVQVPVAFTIVGWTMLADQVGSAQITVSSSSYAAFPSVASIVGGAPPALVSQQKNSQAGLGAWSTGLNAGDVLEFHLDSATTLTHITLELKVTRN